MGHIGLGELIVIGLIIILLFGAKKLPELGSAIGQAIKEFKKASREGHPSDENKLSDKSDDRKS